MKPEHPRFDKERARMLSQLKRRGIKDQRVLQVISEVPRELFVLQADITDSYADSPLPIGLGQTISQPYMVALMTECLELKGHEKILEIGTGSGYQTAILARLAGEVHTIERFAQLSGEALDLLARLGVDNVFATAGDGTKGLADYGPYDGIIVTAGAPEYPAPLKEQLADGGKLVIPVGGKTLQTLKVLTRRGGEYIEKRICECRFVRLIGEYGWEK